MIDRAYTDRLLDHNMLSLKLVALIEHVADDEIVTRDRTVGSLVKSAVTVWRRSQPEIVECFERLDGMKSGPESSEILGELCGMMAANGLAALIVSAVLDEVTNGSSDLTKTDA